MRRRFALFKPGHFDLVITDFQMPQMKGNELAARIKQAWPAQPILMITAYAEQLNQSDSPVDALLDKPFQLRRPAPGYGRAARLNRKKSGHRAGDRSTTQSGNSPPCRVAVLHVPFLAQKDEMRYGVNTPYASGAPKPVSPGIIRG